MKIAQAHDRFFKALLEQPGTAAALLRERLPPAVVSRLGEGEPELVPGSFIDPQLREAQTDRLFRFRQVNGEDLFVYCLVEHKSEPDRWVALQLLGYLVRIWEQLRQSLGPGARLPPVVPLVVYNGEARWTGPYRFSELLELDDELRPLVLDFPFEVLDVGQVPDPRLSGQRLLRAGLMLMKYAYQLPEGDRVELLVGMLEGTRDAPGFLVTALNYILAGRHALERRELLESLAQVAPGKEREMLSNAAKEILEEELENARKEALKAGLEEGREVGREEGRKEGRVETLLRLLELRFHAVPEAVRAKVAAASDLELDRWLERLLKASSLDEVLAER